MPTAETIRIEMADRVADIARAVGGSSVKERLNRAARLLGMTPRRTASYIYRELAVVPAHEADTIRATHSKAKLEKYARMQAELDTLRGELVAEARTGMGALVPPAAASVATDTEGLGG